ncbi:MAG TPA: sugar-binding protein [Spirochaetota bacterium]|nr:sugar-binding protein [Spirochaetota bacterium]
MYRKYILPVFITLLFSPLFLSGEAVTVKVEDFSFVKGYWHIGDWGRFSDVEISATNLTPGPQKQGSSIKIHYYFNKAAMCQLMVNLIRPVLIPGRARHASVMLRGNGRRHEVIALFIDRKGATCAVKFGNIDFTGWRQVEGPIPAVDSKGKPLNYPLAFQGFQIHNWADQSFNSNDYFLADDLLVRSDIQDLKSQAFSAVVNFEDATGIMTPVERTRFFTKIFSWAPFAQQVNLAFVLKNAPGKTAYAKEIRLENLRGYRNIIFSVPGLSCNGYSGLVQLKDRGRILYEHQFHFVISPGNKVQGLKPGSPFGVCVQGHEPMYEQLARIGIKHTRTYHYFPYSWTGESKDDAYYFNGGGGMYNHANHIQSLTRAGVMDLAVITGQPEWNCKYDKSYGGDVTKGPPANYELYAEMISRFTARFKDNLTMAEPYNEPNLEAEKWWGGEDKFPDTFNKVQQAFSKGARQGNPDIKVTTCGMAGFAAPYFKLLKERGYLQGVDIVNGHTYYKDRSPEAANPEKESAIYTGGITKEPLRLIDRYRQMNNFRNRYFPAKKVFLTEVGWSDDKGFGWKVGKYFQACYLVRNWIWAVSEGIDKVYWYFWGDNRWLRKADHHFGAMGIYDIDFFPRPSAGALNVLINQLSGAQYTGDLVFPNAVYAKVFETRDKQPLMIVWADSADSGHYEELLIRPQTAVVYSDMWGNITTNTENKIRVGNAPLYITSLKWPDRVLATANVRDTALRTWPCVAGANKTFSIKAAAVNAGGAGSGKVKISVPNGFRAEPASFSYSPGSSKTVKLKIPYNASRKKLHNWNITVTAANGREKIYRRKIRIIKPFTVEIEPLRGKMKNNPELQTSIKYIGKQPVKTVVKIQTPPSLTVTPPQAELNFTTDLKTNLKFRFKQTGGGPETVYSNITLLMENKKKNIRIAKKVQLGILKTRKLNSKPVINGSLSDWDKRYRLPPDMVLSQLNLQGEIYTAWDKDGLYFAFRVEDSKIQASHQTFWSGDAVELFIDSTLSRSPKANKSTHQFWITLPDGNRTGKKQTARIGRWHMPGDSLRANQPDVDKAEVAYTFNGLAYSIEVFIPESALYRIDLEAGSEYGININISTKEGKELYWLISKAAGNAVLKSPENWGILQLSR